MKYAWGYVSYRYPQAGNRNPAWVVQAQIQIGPFFSAGSKAVPIMDPPSTIQAGANGLYNNWWACRRF